VQVFLTKTHLALVMEYAEGGNMLNCVLGQPNHRLSEVKCRWVFQQLIIGLDFCHRMVRLLPNRTHTHTHTHTHTDTHTQLSAYGRGSLNGL
jgi:hypothetical protein